MARGRALQAVLREAEQLGIEIDSSEDAIAYLNWYEKMARANPGSHHAVAVGTDLVYICPEYANNVRVLREEILHVIQQRRGLEIGAGGQGIAAAEIEVRRIIIQNARKWGISAEEVRELQREIELILERGGY